jgi:hypothetical protein
MDIFYTSPIRALINRRDVSSCGDFATVPHEIVVEIFTYLEPRSALRMPQINRAFYTISDDKKIWERLFFVNVPMARETPQLYEKIGYKRLLMGNGWPDLLAPPRVTIPHYEKVLIACHKVSKPWLNVRAVDWGENPVTIMAVLFQCSALLYDHAYTPLVDLKAGHVMQQFQRSLEQDLQMLDQLNKSLESEPSEQRNRSEAMMMIRLQHKITVIDKQLHHNPRWSVDSTNSIVIRQRPYMVSAAIPALPKNATLLTVQPLSNAERVTKQQEIVELKSQVKGMQQLLTAKQTALNTTYPWYKKIGHALLLVIATLMTVAATALCLLMLYSILKFFLSPLQRGRRAIPSKL